MMMTLMMMTTMMMIMIMMTMLMMIWHLSLHFLISLSLSRPLISPNTVTQCVTLPNLNLADSSSFLPSFSLPLSYCPHSQPNNVTATVSRCTDKIANGGTAANQSDYLAHKMSVLDGASSPGYATVTLT
jgi:hypothetical protein